MYVEVGVGGGKKQTTSHIIKMIKIYRVMRDEDSSGTVDRVE